MKVIIAILFSWCVVAQEKLSLDNDCLLLGMIGEPVGHVIMPEHPTFRNYFATVQSDSLRSVFISIITTNYGIDKREIVEEDGMLFNAKMRDKLKSYYHLPEANADSIFTDKDGKDYKLYRMDLDPHRFVTTQQKLSFLVGVFLQCGHFSEGEITLTSWYDTSDNVTNILSDLGFEYCESARGYYATGAARVIRFKPSDDFLDFFKRLSERKKIGW